MLSPGTPITAMVVGAGAGGMLCAHALAASPRFGLVAGPTAASSALAPRRDRNGHSRYPGTRGSVS